MTTSPFNCGSINPKPSGLSASRGATILLALEPWPGTNGFDLKTTTLHLRFERSADAVIRYSALPIQLRLETGERFSVHIEWVTRLDNILQRHALLCERVLQFNEE